MIEQEPLMIKKDKKTNNLLESIASRGDLEMKDS